MDRILLRVDYFCQVTASREGHADGDRDGEGGREQPAAEALALGGRGAP